MAAKQASQGTKSRKGFWPGTETGENVPRRSLRCRRRRKRVPVWRSRGSQVWGYALACGGRRNREEADCFLSQAGLSSLLTSGVR